MTTPQIRLLIADDSAEIRNSARLMLSMESGIEVVSLARDGQETVDLARELQPDIAVIDIHMPRKDGLTAMRELAQVSPQTICMVISYEKENDYLRQAMAAGAREYLIKPFNTDELITAVRRVTVKVIEARQKAEAARRAEEEAAHAAALAHLAATEAQQKAEAARDAAEKAQLQVAAAQAAAKERDDYVKQLAFAYLNSGRTDAEAAEIYAELGSHSNLEPFILQRLAEIFLQKSEWRKLKLICDRLDELHATFP